jgi:hypothetical protein
VEALAVDPSTEVAFVLLSGLEQLVAVPLKMPDSTELVQLPGQAPIGSWSKQARLMAFERGSRKLLLGVGGALMALHFPEQPGHVPVPVGAWRREGFRAPVALAPGD